MRDWLILFCAVAVLGCDSKVAGGRADGVAVYMEACARCHGKAGVPPPEMAMQLGVADLSSADLQARLGDQAMRDRVLHGVPQKGMPAFAGALTSEQVDAVIQHVRSLKKP